MKYVIKSASTWCANEFLDIYSDKLSDAGFNIQVLSEDDEDKATVIITLKSIRDLVKLVNTVGSLIISDRDVLWEGYPRITIYDDYIE